MNNTASLIDHIGNIELNVEAGLLHVNIAHHKGVFCINNNSEFYQRTQQNLRENTV